MGPISPAFLTEACAIPNVIDVSPAERFGEPITLVSIPTSAERAEVESLLPAEGYEDRLYVMPVFGLGSFTGDTKETKDVVSLMYISPYNVYGTPENKELEKLMDDAFEREAQAWASMTAEEKREAIDQEVERQRASGRPEFGNCWSD